MNKLVGLVGLLLASLLSGCTSSGQLREQLPVAISRPSSEPNLPKVVTVYYATDRAPTSDGTGFGPDRIADGSISRGTVRVNIPPERDRGEIPRPGWFEWFTGPDPEEDMFIREMSTLSKDQFYAAIKANAGAEKSVFVFVHGYNNTFEDAALRTAQIAYDLGLPNLPALFSWSSAGRELAYPTDSDSAELARPAFVEFINDLIAKSDARKLYILGHSMGTRIVSQGVSEVIEKKPEWKGRIKEVLLAAADMNAETFRTQIAPRMLAAQLNVTLYVSANDKTLKFSKRYQTYTRVGDIQAGRPLLIQGMETIDASRVSTDWLAHSYFASSAVLLTDIETLFRNGDRASKRAPLRLSTEVDGGKRFWYFP